MPNILFISAHRLNRSPSQRFRFEQYFSFLKENGFDYDFSYLISEKFDRVFYQPGNFHSKAWIFLASAWKRWVDVIRSKQYDIVFVQREAFMSGTAFFEKQFSKNAKLVFDFDDAIWHLDISGANKKFGWLKNPGKTARIISMSDAVISGNQYLAKYAKQYNKNVIIIPTTIDTNEYIRVGVARQDETVVIGWSGSLTTIKHFEYAIPFLKQLKDKYGNRIVIKVIGDPSYRNSELEIKGLAWSRETELMELSSFDIGIMPLPDDEWANGKCGLKALQYMALEIPTVVSPVGMNTEIITDGVNGFLASTGNNWVEKISGLIENPALRAAIGRQARKTVIEKYSVNSQKEKYLACMRELLR
jgi:glycosyltransferase involved in cell wall biosynthesis